MSSDILIRLLLGGAIVSLFAVLGDMFRPRSFAGLFGAAPSVALATLALTMAREGSSYAATEGRSMMAGAVALCAYSQLASWLMMRHPLHALAVTLFSLILWVAVAFGLWFIILR